MEKQEKLVPNGILKAPKVELLQQVHNETAMVKPEMELPAQAEEDNSEDTKVNPPYDLFIHLKYSIFHNEDLL